MVRAQVSIARVGERVWVWNAARGRASGTAAEFVVLPANQAVPLPDNIPTEVGACLGIPALTAWHAVNVDGGVAGKTFLSREEPDPLVTTRYRLQNCQAPRESSQR